MSLTAGIVIAIVVAVVVVTVAIIVAVVCYVKKARKKVTPDKVEEPISLDNKPTTEKTEPSV